MPTASASKKDWYINVFAFDWPDSDDKLSLVVEDLGIIDGKKVHLTVFRPTWQYRFQPAHGTEEIFDRIFGSGTGGIHVTLEMDAPVEADDDAVEPPPVAVQEPGLHCYLNGPNQGRNDDEKKQLADLLDKWINTFKGQIGDRVKDYTDFEFLDADDVNKPLDFLFVDVKTDGFEEMARQATTKHGIDVVYPAQADSALLWTAAAVHPMQPLQNTFQRLVRDSCSDLDGDVKMAKESEELGKYCYFGAGTPKLMGLPKDADPDIETQLSDIEKLLAKLKSLIPEMDPDITAKHLEKAGESLWKLRGLFNFKPGDPAKKAAKSVPGLSGMEKNFKGFKKQMDAAKKSKLPADFEKIRGKLVRSHKELSFAILGMCCIQNFHTIEPFYLFRLLVKFQIQSDKAIESKVRTGVSSTLTGLLHNSTHMEWLFEWLRDKLVELDAALKKACPEKGPKSDDWPDGEPLVIFFLKGGRAAKYLQDLPKKGENDWDTNIVINPTLRAGDWYKNFLRVHNTVLAFLEKAKREFCVQAYQGANYSKFVTALGESAKVIKADKEKADAPDPDSQALAGMAIAEGDMQLLSDLQQAIDDEAELQLQRAVVDPLAEKESENCKAELIDIGIPRRDTVEAFEQWFNVCPRIITCDDKIPIPGHLYYIAEYVMMIREAFMDKSVSMQKTPKRVIRLLEVLEMQKGLQDRIDAEKKHIPDGTLKLSMPAIESQSEPVKRMLTILLKQFVEAYDLAEDAGLAEQFDTVFKKDLDNMEAKAKYPASLKSAIEKEGDAYLDKHKKLANAIGYAQWISQEIDTHLRDERAKFMLDNRLKFTNFVKAIYTASVFGQADDLEVQFAVTGSFAALLHAEYGKLEEKRMKELEPFKRLDLTIFCQKDHDPATVRELITPLIKKYIENPTTPNFDMQERGEDSLCLTWPTEQAFKSFTYKPMVIKVTVEKAEEDWPQLSFIKGLPVLSLRDLVWATKRRAGHIEETFTQRGLRTGIDALVDILTRFENPNAGKPWDVPPPDPPPDPGPLPDDEDKIEGEEILFHPDPVIHALKAGTAHYLMMSWHEGAVGPGANYPDSIPAAKQYKITVPADLAPVKQNLSMGDGSQDRTLDLLVFNQGHGDVGNLFGFSPADLKTNIVDPLVKSKVKAKIVVLDACLTASVVETFAPLLTDDGHMIANLYTLNSVVVDKDTWGAIKDQLDGTQADAVYTVLETRMKKLARENTGQAWATTIDGMDDQAIAGLLVSCPNAADQISAAKYLNEIRQVLEAAEGPDPAFDVIYSGLDPTRQKPQLHAKEKAILNNLTDASATFTKEKYEALKTAFATRLKSLLKDATYKVQLPDSLDGLALFGADSLWSRFAANRKTVLANAPGLTRCPTSFAVYNSESLTADRALSGTLSATVQALLNQIDQDAVTDVPNVLAAVGEVIFEDNYLQP